MLFRSRAGDHVTVERNPHYWKKDSAGAALPYLDEITWRVIATDEAQVVRFQGGHNAGHTLVIGSKTFKLSLLPSGVVRPGKLSVIGNGVVVDPWALLAEIDKLQKKAAGFRQKLQVISRGMKPKQHRATRWSLARVRVKISLAIRAIEFSSATNHEQKFSDFGLK